MNDSEKSREEPLVGRGTAEGEDLDKREVNIQDDDGDDTAEDNILDQSVPAVAPTASENQVRKVAESGQSAALGSKNKDSDG